MTNGRPHHNPENKPEGGSWPVDDLPPDQPKKARGPIFFIIVVIGALLLFAPIAWAFITLVAVGGALTTTAKVVFWSIWGVCVVAFIWIVIVLWRRAA
jgi:hypothetical protein